MTPGRRALRRRTHPAMRKMTRSGSRATVKRKRAAAGPKAMKVQPKNTAVVMAGPDSYSRTHSDKSLCDTAAHLSCG